MQFEVKHLRQAVQKLSVVANATMDELNTQDGKLGDGDLGITLSKGWAEAAAQVLPDNDLGRSFLLLSKAFQRVSSSSFGTLLATGLLAAAKSTKDKSAENYAEIGYILINARDAMMARGKSRQGQKSVIDAIDAAAKAAKGLSEPHEIAAATRKAVDKSLEEFRDKRSGLGRARMYGPVSKGLDDPGMLAFKRMLDGLLD